MIPRHLPYIINEFLFEESPLLLFIQSFNIDFYQNKDATDNIFLKNSDISYFSEKKYCYLTKIKYFWPRNNILRQ